MTQRQSILVLDNYDSFTFNLVHYLIELGAKVDVIRADAITPMDALLSGAQGFVISPGPGRPEQAGGSLGLVQACASAGRPLLGVCLGHQAIAAHFGATIVRAFQPMHGKTSAILHDRTGVFANLPSPLEATRYHSLMVDPATVPADLIVNGWSHDGAIQGLRHRRRPIHSVQFHPESAGTQCGHELLRNFLAIAAG